MGTWGTGAFDNDDASDWTYELDDAHDAGPVRAALEIGGADDHLQAPDGSVAIAAAEAVAAALGRPATSLPDEVRAWVARAGASVTPTDAVAALTAIGRVLADDSELRELCDEDTGALRELWMAGIYDLRRRLTTASE